MAGRVDPRDAPVLLTVIPNTAQSLKGVYNKNTNSNDKITVADEIIQYQGDLPGLKDGTTVSNPRSMRAGRFDSQELPSGSLTVTGWYKVAISDVTSFSNYSGFISFSDFASRISGLMAVFSGCSSNSALAERHIEILSKYNWNSGSVSVIGIRLGVSNISTSGAVIELNLNIPAGSSILASQIMGNLASSTLIGMSLITPVISDGLLPDGVTAATFLEAGEELNFDNSSARFSPVMVGRRVDDDNINVSVNWKQIPKQGTGVTLTIPSVSLLMFDGIATAKVITSPNFSSLEIDGEIIHFTMSEINIGLAMTQSILSFQWTGTGGKLTIT